MTQDMSHFRGELSEREQELLKIRRDSDTKAAELAKMEKMLQHTKSLLEKKTEFNTESKDFQDSMGLYQNQKLKTCCIVHTLVM